jgi:hypothetical protein
VTRGQWELIATIKYPVMADRESSIRVALESPDEMRQSGTDTRNPSMAELSVLYDRDGRTLTVWDRHQEHICEEAGGEVVLMKDSVGRVIGFEKLNFSIPETDRLRVAIETTPA